MKISDEDRFDAANMFGKGQANTAFAAYFIGQSYVNPLTRPGESPLFLVNVTFEPGCRNNWHTHEASTGGGQMLICTAGEGWYQREGKKPVSLAAGSVVCIPAGVKHWHGAKANSWFSHIAVEVPGAAPRTEWREPVADAYYRGLPAQRAGRTATPPPAKTYATKHEFDRANIFGTGMRNFMLSRSFSGRSYLKSLTMPGRAPLFLANVTFEPGCRNNWHIHHATTGGGQILICTAGSGWYQAEGSEAVRLEPGMVISIPAGVKHWHGAQADSWFSHIALAVPGENSKNEWCEPVSDAEYAKL